jgi:hypothetical protein
LRVEEKQNAIHCDAGRDPSSGRGCDLRVWKNCNAHTYNCAFPFAETYTNDTGLDGRAFFTDSRSFTVKVAEVSKIVGETAVRNSDFSASPRDQTEKTQGWQFISTMFIESLL